MATTRYTLTSLYLFLLCIVCVLPVFAAEQFPSQPYPWPWWHAMPWPSFFWIFPLMFFIFMVAMIIIMMRRGGMGCMWRDRIKDSPEFRDAMKWYSGESAESALDILNKRYAKGEIDKQEYEEKKAAISQSG